MDGAYLVPAGAGTAEFTEKRSVFTGNVWPVETEDEARARIEEMRKKYHDARHNCWCYILSSGAVRYSDDGEPQGTAGQPMLGVFQKEGITNVCCVVTRYFGGILLGAGGLVRAYSQAAKSALDAAGIAEMRRWAHMAVDCPYNFLERVKKTCLSAGGTVGEIQYTAAVRVEVFLPEEAADAFADKMVELSGGGFVPERLGEIWKAFPVR